MKTRASLRRIAHSRYVSLSLGLVVFIAWGLFLHSQLRTLQNYPWNISLLAFSVSIGWGTVYSGGMAICWAFLLRHIGGYTGEMSLMVAARIWLLSMITRYVPGNVWHILSRIALAGRFQVSATHVLTSASIEQVLALLGALVLFGVTLPFWETAVSLRGVQTWLLLLLPIGLTLLHPRIFGTVLQWVAQRFNRPELIWHYTFRDLLFLLFIYTCATLGLSLALVTVVWGLTPITPAHLPLLIGAAALAWVIGYLSFITPSGLGVREALLVALLAQLYPLPVAIVGSLVFRLVMTFGELFAVLVAWIYGRFVTTTRVTINDSESSTII